eukprot:8541942-Alexandrium_andersonii.AAC.1
MDEPCVRPVRRRRGPSEGPLDTGVAGRGIASLRGCVAQPACPHRRAAGGATCVCGVGRCCLRGLVARS